MSGGRGAVSPPAAVLQRQFHGHVLRDAALHDGAQGVLVQADQVAVHD